MTPEYAAKFKKAVVDVCHCGFLLDLYEEEPGVFFARATQGWNEVAFQLAERLPGQIMPAKGAGGVVWNCGNTKTNPAPHGIIANLDRYGSIQKARGAAKSIGVLQESSRPLFSFGSIARAIIKSVFPDNTPYNPSCEEFLTGVKFGFHCCTPGVYVSRETPYIETPMRDLFDRPGGKRNPAYTPATVHFDVSAYYFDMISRLQSFHVEPLRGGLWFGSRSKGQQMLWDDALSAISETKVLRNSVFGAMVGSRKKSTAYTSAKPRRPSWYAKLKKEEQAVIDAGIAAWVPGTVRKISLPPVEGMHRSAGLLVMRSGYELCQIAAMQTEAIYGTIDSVITTGAEPVIWKKHGFHVKREHEGDAEICHRGSWRVGLHETLPYTRGDRHKAEPTGYGNSPPVLYYKFWL